MANNEVRRSALKPSVNHSYFYMPPAWIGSEPGALELNHPTSNHIKVVCTRQLSVGIRVDAHRDDVFTFDFTGLKASRSQFLPRSAETATGVRIGA